MFDKLKITTDVDRPYFLTDAARLRILDSLRCNGIAVLRGFLAATDVTELQKTAEVATSDGFVYGAANAIAAKVIESEGTRDFPHPFLISKAATKLVTTGSLLDVVEDFLGESPIIHHALFQRSMPVSKALIDWHIDCGSNKKMNGITKFPDLRLRSILYLSDVESGGLGYVLGSAEAAKNVFLAMPNGPLFPVDQVPSDPDRKIMVDERAGTLILFDTHGLHRPEIPKQERLVMNTWFARKDFSAKLPPVLFSISDIPASNRDRIGVFENARGQEALVKSTTTPPNVIKRMAREVIHRLVS